jgi:glycosyltransferase involved in cell wall biosynthesis
MKSFLKALARKGGFEVSRVPEPDPLERVVSLESTKSKGRALLSYGIRPYLLKPGEPINSEHTTAWESLQIGKTFLELGYALDVVHYTNQRFVPARQYACFVGVLMGFGRIAPLLNPDCIKVLHVVYAHWLVHNRAQYERLADLQRRRGIVLSPVKLVQPHLGIEYADYATVLGNEFTMATYAHAGKPMFPIPIATLTSYPWPDGKDFDRCRKNFIWLGGIGLVHKGLDLLLEAFAEMPEYRLEVCGPISGEKDFERAYHKELYETSNIRTRGFVDVTSPAFTELAGNCIALLHPSCSEGQSGAVATCMQAGLIPLVSRQSGIDVNDYGFVLESSVEGIKRAVREVSALSTDELARRSRGAWEYARKHHTRESFACQYKKVLADILSRLTGARGAAKQGSS